MRNGMLGVVIIAIAISIALFGSYLAGVTPHEEEYTNFEYLTDVNVLFDYDTTPRYIDYDPSTNYTGYHTTEEPEYFAGVKAITTTKVNQYKLNLGPLSDVTEALDLSEVQYTSTIRFHYWTNNEGQTSKDVNQMTVNELIGALNIDADSIIITSNQGSYQTGGFFSFYLDQWKVGSNIFMRAPDVTGDLKFRDSADGPSVSIGDASTVTVPVLCGIYDSATGNIALYTDVEKKNLLGTYLASNVVVLWNNTHSGTFWLGNQGTTRAIEYPPKTYMDPAYGVKLEE